MARRDPNAVAMLRVFLVDDAPVIRKGLQSLLNREPDLRTCGEAGGEQEALKGILATRPDLAFVDLCLNEGEGLNLIRKLHVLRPELRILVFAARDQMHLATSMFAAGAHGYLLKDEGLERIMPAIRAVLAGDHYLSTAVAAKTPGLEPPSPLRGSTRRA